MWTKTVCFGGANPRAENLTELCWSPAQPVAFTKASSRWSSSVGKWSLHLVFGFPAAVLGATEGPPN